MAVTPSDPVMPSDPVTPSDPVKLPEAEWRQREGLAGLLDALDADRGATRFVGGAVRDTLFGTPVTDVDLATRLLPDAVMARLKAAGIRAVPTGIDHGTVTAVIASQPVEVTTLRRDVTTDGRRATIAWADDWREDAARRDFTINALYADPASGEVHDYFGGIDDLRARRVRFIGDPVARIAEDHLRILRFFRFQARFGTGEPDAAAMAACIARANDLMALSRERIADELLKLLALADPAPVVATMTGAGIFLPVLPEIDSAACARLQHLTVRERQADEPPDAVRRLAALVPQEPSRADAVAARLKLSNAIRKRLMLAVDRFQASPVELLYRRGREGAGDVVLLSDSADPASAMAALRAAERPVLPLSGGALIAMGLSAGPDVARALRQVETRWIAEGFPDARRVSALAAETVGQVTGRDRKS